MKAVTAAQMREIDRKTIEEYGIPAAVLMYSAGKAVSDRIIDRYGGAKRIAVFCGTGNNGGDGFVVSHFLHNAGFVVTIYITGNKNKLSGVSAPYLSLCERDGIPAVEATETSFAGMDPSGFDLVVDAILGTGFTGSVRGVPALAVNWINESTATVVSVDQPSGLPSENDPPLGPAVKADATVTIGLPKISLVTYPGVEYTGKLFVADIGFPRELTESDSLAVELVDEEYAGRFMNENSHRDINKSTRGHLLIAGGFPGMEGAALMSGMAALKTGIGYGTLLTSIESRPVIAGKIPEMMTLGVDPAALAGGGSAKAAIAGILEGREYDALVIGPGLGRSEAAKNLFYSLIETAHDFGIGHVLVDGDGLYLLARYLEKNSLNRHCRFILTPHLMEASRLLGCPVDDVKNARFRHAVMCAEKTGAVTLLKGPSSIVTDGTRTLINTSGNPCLATAGTGDILSGIIGAFLLRDIPALAAAGIGAFVHGNAADRYVKTTGKKNMGATELLSYI